MMEQSGDVDSDSKIEEEKKIVPGMKRKRDDAVDKDDSVHYPAKKKRRTQVEREEIAEIERRIAEETVPPGSSETKWKTFEEMPISSNTKRGLRENKFETLTSIQQRVYPHALAGRDILGSSKTGSGKTLAYLVPVVEKLFRLQWTSSDGIGALILSPTRELALQINQNLKFLVRPHLGLTFGLITGGKDYKAEQKMLGCMNILICTPGRLIQHLQESPTIDMSNVKCLVLDEADLMIDIGFESQIKEIMEYLPSSSDRQTFLFSATQSKTVKKLATVSMSSPEQIMVSEGVSTKTPDTLAQSYVVCELYDKLNFLLSFFKSHLKCKILVFLTTCKQVKYVFEVFRRYRVGIPVMELNGKLKQAKRMFTYYKFLQSPEAIMFCTDVAARGLDFPHVDWVIQADCPESWQDYLHRAGRTARMNVTGRSLLLLLPTELKFVNKLHSKGIELTEVKMNPKKGLDLTSFLASNTAEDNEFHQLAQKAVTSYIRSIHLQPDKEVFSLTELPLAQYAKSLGLSSAPKLKFTSVDKKLSVPSESSDVGSSTSDSQDSKLKEEKEKVKKQIEALRLNRKQRKLLKLKQTQIEKKKEKKLTFAQVQVPKTAVMEPDDDLIVTKRTIRPEDDFDVDEMMKQYEGDGADGGAGAPSVPSLIVDPLKKPLTKTMKRKLMLSSKNMNERFVFDDDGELVKQSGTQALCEIPSPEDFNVKSIADASSEFAEKIKGKLREADEEDIINSRSRVKSKHSKKKEKERKLKEKSIKKEDYERKSKKPENIGIENPKDAYGITHPYSLDAENTMGTTSFIDNELLKTSDASVFDMPFRVRIQQAVTTSISSSVLLKPTLQQQQLQQLQQQPAQAPSSPVSIQTPVPRFRLKGEFKKASYEPVDTELRRDIMYEGKLPPMSFRDTLTTPNPKEFLRRRDSPRNESRESPTWDSRTLTQETSGQANSEKAYRPLFDF